MKKTASIFLAALTLSVVSCKKDSEPTPDNFATIEQEVLDDFTSDVAISQYLDLKNNAATLNSAVLALNTDATEANIVASRNAWINMRAVWESCEGFLFGPVEDNDYDPQIDTWPTDFNQFDSLMASTNPLEVSDVEALPLNLRGYHPIEYIIFGDHGDRQAINLTDRQKKYMVSATASLKGTCDALYASWTQAPENFGQQVTTAGKGSTKYTSRQEVYLAMVGGLIGICGEVGDGKMKEPFDALDPNIVESPYSGNSTTDFKNNIIGAQTVYLGRNGGKGLTALVAERNKALDQKLKAQFAAAISSFDVITAYYEDAIITQRVQVQQSMDAINTLAATMEDELIPFVLQNILD